MKPLPWRIKLRGPYRGLTNRLAVSMREMEKADFILAVGADPVNEAPMLALAMRQAFKDGAGVAPIFPLPTPPAFITERQLLCWTPARFFFPWNSSICRLPREIRSPSGRFDETNHGPPCVEGLSPEARKFYDPFPSEYPFDGPLQDHFVRNRRNGSGKAITRSLSAERIWSGNPPSTWRQILPSS